MSTSVSACCRRRTSKLVERMLSMSATVNNLGTAWNTKVLERCPETWQMLVQNVGKWQEKNTPEGTGVELPSTPGEEGWRAVDVPHQAVDVSGDGWVPVDTSAEEAELARMKEAPDAA